MCPKCGAHSLHVNTDGWMPREIACSKRSCGWRSGSLVSSWPKEAQERYYKRYPKAKENR